jgi:hypothetical protein
LALAIHYGLVGTVRAPLRSGRYRTDEELPYGLRTSVEGIERRVGGAFCRPLHLAVVPAPRHRSDPQLAPRHAILSVLVREFGADVNGRDHCGKTPPALAEPPDHPNSRDLKGGGGPWTCCCRSGRTSRRATTPGRRPSSAPPTMATAWCISYCLVARRPMRSTKPGLRLRIYACNRDDPAAIWALLRASSPETRRAVDNHGRSAIDALCAAGLGPMVPWREEVLVQLLSGGARPFTRATPTRLGLSLPPSALSSRRGWPRCRLGGRGMRWWFTWRSISRT